MGSLLPGILIVVSTHHANGRTDASGSTCAAGNAQMSPRQPDNNALVSYTSMVACDRAARERACNPLLSLANACRWHCTVYRQCGTEMPGTPLQQRPSAKLSCAGAHFTACTLAALTSHCSQVSCCGGSQTDAACNCSSLAFLTGIGASRSTGVAQLC